MPAVAALEKRRAQLEAKKQALLSKVEQCTERIEKLRAIRKVQQILWDSSESDVEESEPPPSEELQHQLDHLNMKLQATQELCGVDELTVEAVPMQQRPEHVAMLVDEETGGGVWREVSARGRIEYVPFKMKFLLYENAQKALHYRSLTTSVTKPLQSAELHNTVLHSCRSPGEAVYCLVSYSKVYKERRDAMLALNERYRDDINIQTTECGGYQLSCFDVLEIEWLLVCGTTALDSFRHRFLMSCEDNGSLVENHLRILKDTYKNLKDPKNNSTGRMRCLCKIIDICLQVYRNSILQNTEVGAYGDEMVNSGRKPTTELEEQEKRKIGDVKETDVKKKNNRYNDQNNKKKIINGNVIENREKKVPQKKTSETNQKNMPKKKVEKAQENTQQNVQNNSQKHVAKDDASQNIARKRQKYEQEERKTRGDAEEIDKKKENNRKNDQNNKNKIATEIITENREKKVQQTKIQESKCSNTNQRNKHTQNVEKVQENAERIINYEDKDFAHGDANQNIARKLQKIEQEVRKIRGDAEETEQNNENNRNSHQNNKNNIKNVNITEHRKKNVQESKIQEKKSLGTNQIMQKKNFEKVQESTEKNIKNKQTYLANGAEKHIKEKNNRVRENEPLKVSKSRTKNNTEISEKTHNVKQKTTETMQELLTEHREKNVQEKKSSDSNQRSIQKRHIVKVQGNTEKIVKNKQKDIAHGDARQNDARELQNIEQEERYIRDSEETIKKKEDNRKNDQINKNKIKNLKITEHGEKKVQEMKSSESNQKKLEDKKNLEKDKENTENNSKNKQKDAANSDTKLNGTEEENNSNKENETELPPKPSNVTKNIIKKNAEISEKIQRKEITAKEKTREVLNSVHKSTMKGKLKDNIINKKVTNSNLLKPSENGIQKDKINKNQVKCKESPKVHPFGMEIPLSPIRKVTSAANVTSEHNNNRNPDKLETDTVNGHLNILGKRKANTKEIPKTKIPRMIPAQIVQKSVTPRRSPRKPFVVNNKEKGFFFGKK